MAKTLLAIDQGTTSTRAILFDTNGNAIKTEQIEFPLIHPHKGWVEQDPTQIWNDTQTTTNALIQHAKDNNLDIAACGITNQRETTILWNKTTGQPIYNAIVWQDRRTADLCKQLKQYEPTIIQKTGLMLDPYFSATKIKWILDNVDGARQTAQDGNLAFGTIDSFLLWHLTGGKSHLTDATNASRTMLYNIHTHQWETDLLELFDIPENILPTVTDNTHPFGETSSLNAPIPITGMAGDQQSALIGQACFEKGMIKSTYGTGCFALMNIGKIPAQSHNRLLTTIAYQINGQTTYALEGSIFIAGAAIQWLRDNLGIITNAAETEKIATSINDSAGVTFIPAFTGLGAPYWNPNANAAIMGLSRDTNAAHIIRAALEAQAFQTKDLMDAMTEDSGTQIKTLRIDGGLSKNNFVAQTLADILQTTIQRPKSSETTALGAAYLAGLGANIYSSLNDIKHHWHAEQTNTPSEEPAQLKDAYENWKNRIDTLNQSS